MNQYSNNCTQSSINIASADDTGRPPSMACSFCPLQQQPSKATDTTRLPKIAPHLAHAVLARGKGEPTTMHPQIRRDRRRRDRQSTLKRQAPYLPRFLQHDSINSCSTTDRQQTRTNHVSTSQSLFDTRHVHSTRHNDAISMAPCSLSTHTYRRLWSLETSITLSVSYETATDTSAMT